MAKIGIIGAGFSGLSAACYCAKQGHEVTVFEKHTRTGGRARSFQAENFMFDMGPSWYWMPDIFEKFFADFGKKPSDYYTLKLLDPSFQIFFPDGQPFIVPARLEDLYDLFESIEKGSAEKLRQFLKEGELKYRVAMDKLIYKPSVSWLEFASYEVISSAMKTNIFISMRQYIRRFFKDERLITLMEFPVIFLGAMPDKIPALYSLMNYAAFDMGTWYPMGGMCRITEGMEALARSLGVKFELGTGVEKLETENGLVTGVRTAKGFFKADSVIAKGKPDVPGTGQGGLADGLPTQMNPGIFLDKFTNDLIVFVDTDPAKQGDTGFRESVRISDIPLKKPFYVHVSVHDQILEVYVNCRLAATKLLQGSPRAVPNDWYGRIGFARAAALIQNLRLWDIDLYAFEVLKLCPPIVVLPNTAPSSCSK